MLKQFDNFVNEELNIPDELEGPISSEFKNYNERLISKPENETYIRGIFTKVAEMLGTPLNKIFDIKLENAPALDEIIKKYDEHLQIKHTDSADINTKQDSDESSENISFTLVQNEDNDFKGVFISSKDKRRLATDKNGLKFLDELYEYYDKGKKSDKSEDEEESSEDEDESKK